jgi:anionic cell wall polymer biosynthesis LytR-Cps2A-Psr (LCP) family protein
MKVIVMKKLLIGLFLIIIMLSPVYSASGFAVTYGKTTYGNANLKNTVNTYFNQKPVKILMMLLPRL